MHRLGEIIVTLGDTSSLSRSYMGEYTSSPFHYTASIYGSAWGQKAENIRVTRNLDSKYDQ